MKIVKPILIYIVSFGLLFLAIHYSQQFIIEKLNTTPNFNLKHTNAFFAIASLLICIHFNLFSKLKGLQNYLGFIYLPTLFIKGILFFLAFRTTIFTSEMLSMPERINLLIPSLLFLGLEVYFIAQILNEKKQ